MFFAASTVLQWMVTVFLDVMCIAASIGDHDRNVRGMGNAEDQLIAVLQAFNREG